jgi:hypothetical protein
MIGRFRSSAPGVTAAVALLLLGACTTNGPVPLSAPAVDYPIFSVETSMSCDAMTASFVFSARRAARLEYWLEVGRLPGYGTDMYGVDAPKEIAAERRRLDALSDLQRTRGCPVMEPGPAVAYERQKLEGAIPRAPLRVLG